MNIFCDMFQLDVFVALENLGGGFKHFLISPVLGEDSHFD